MPACNCFAKSSSVMPSIPSGSLGISAADGRPGPEALGAFSFVSILVAENSSSISAMAILSYKIHRGPGRTHHLNRPNHPHLDLVHSPRAEHRLALP